MNDELQAPERSSANASPPAWRASLILTKMTPPRPPRARVNRSLLLERLKEGSEASLTIVIAPAGFGKTTLLAEWCESLMLGRHVVGWLSLDEDDDDDQQFCSYIAATLSLGSPNIAWRTVALLHNDPLTPVKTIVSVLLNDIASCDRDIYLVLDDFDRLQSKSVRAIAYRLLRYSPPNLHFILGVRCKPDLPIGQLRTQRSLLCLDAEDLRFTQEDSRIFLTQMGCSPLNDSEIELLHSATEGWVAGLQLVALTIRDDGKAVQLAREFSSQQFGVDSYFEEAVLQSLPTNVVQFLLQTSILDRLNSDLCDELLGEPDTSWLKIDWLERNNVFIRVLDIDRKWFRIHRLLRDALLRQAACQINQKLPLLHKKASGWFAMHGLWSEAVRHAIAGGWMQEAACYVEQCAMSLLDRSDARTLLSWISRIPNDVLQKRPRLRLDMAWAQVLSRNAEQARDTIEVLLADLERVEDGTNRNSFDGLKGEIYAVSGLIEASIGDSARALERGRAALQRTANSPQWAQLFAQCALAFGLSHAAKFEEVRALESMYPIGLSLTLRPVFPEVFRMCMFGLNAMLEGRLERAVEIYGSALALAESSVGRESAAAALSAGPLAALLYERNELDRARQVISGRTALVMEGATPGSLVRFCRTSAALFARDGDIGSALSILDEGRQLSNTNFWIRLRSGCDAEAIRLLIQKNSLEQAIELLMELQSWFDTRFNPEDEMSNRFESWCNFCYAKSRILIAQGHNEDALNILKAIKNKSAKHGLKYQEAHASILLAIAYKKCGKTELAQSTLRPIFSYAAQENLVASFIDEGGVMQSILEDWRPGYGESASTTLFVARLIALVAARPIGGGLPIERIVNSNTSCLLRTREVEILIHISKGSSNKKIARALGVAPETIKWHLRNIFEKLDVSSRIEAAQVGLGLDPAVSSLKFNNPMT